jgi:DNA topoisomerase-1
MSPYTAKKHEIQISAPEDAKYVDHVEIPTHLGWKKLAYSDEVSADTTTTESPTLFYYKSVTNPIPWSKIETEQVLKTQKSHYTEAALIQKLEDLGIGRPSTFSSIVSTIEDRGYVKKTDIPGIKIECVEYTMTPGSEIKTKKTEKMAGQEKGKLAIQPIGSLVLEYLLHHFDTFFSYGYTESMESELDKIARLTSKDATEKWHHICRTCLDQIEEKMKPLKTAKKQTFPLDNPEYELIFNSYGISIKHTLEDGSKEYLSIKPGIEIDL